MKRQAPPKKTSLPLLEKAFSAKDLTVLAGVCIATFICFSYTLSNQFLFWDDNQFIVNNVHLRRLSWENIKYLFSHEFGANWQPLTMLSYSLNYYFSKYSPFGYFFTNVLLHVANTALVFLVVKKLMALFKNDSAPKLIIPALASLWFGIHPMHVESVGWLFERKDVLYVFFYLSGLLVYLNYSKNKKPVQLFYVFLLFLCSCMSKPMAVVFPGSLILIDFLLGRKLTRNVWLEKLPFVLLSLIIGILTLHTQKDAHALVYTFSLTDRFLIASYSFLEYIIKLIYPLNLSGFYPYPMNPGESLPSYFYVKPILVLLVTALPLYYAYKKDKTWFKVLAFGFGFYLVNIALVLQFLSVGFAIISDRYSYVSYIGLFFILAYGVNEFVHSKNAMLRNGVIAVAIFFTSFWAYECYQRTKAWHNTETMLTDVIRQYPAKVPQAYKYLGIYYGESGRLQDAFNCYDVMINKMHLQDADAYCNMGRVLMSMNNLKDAVNYLNASLKIDSNIFSTYLNLGIICADSGNYTGALHYYQKANSIAPYDESLYNNMSYAHVGAKQWTDAINDYNVLLQLNPDNTLYYFNRGVAEYTMGNKDAALGDFVKTLNMPVLQQNVQYHLNANAAYNLSVIYKERGDEQKSAEYAKMAQQLGR